MLFVVTPAAKRPALMVGPKEGLSLRMKARREPGTLRRPFMLLPPVWELLPARK